MAVSETVHPHGVIATGHAAVTEAAATILRGGGNAFDAAVGAGFASAVAEPGLTSLGGGGFLLAHRSDGQSVLFDFFVNTPGTGLDTIPDDPHFVPATIRFGGSDQVFHVGRGSIAVPGTLAGLLHVHRRLGRTPLEHVVAPAVELARHGLEVTPIQAFIQRILRPILWMSPEGAGRFGRDGAPLQAGDRLFNTPLARFLLGLPESAESLYSGRIAARIEADVEGEGSLRAADLSAYRVLEREPLAVDYRGSRLLTNPPPSVGGSLLALSLALLEPHPLAQHAWRSGPHLSLLASLQIEVERLRAEGVGGPADLRADERAKTSERLRVSSGGTTHLCVCDREGNVASMTNSNGEGSGYIVPETGIMLNNMLGEDDLHPEGFHADPPAERVASMMSPSILLRDGLPRLALGSGGSKRIRNALLQVLTHVVDFERPIEEAVVSPRLHWDGEALQVEPGFDEDACAELERRFPANVWDTLNLYFGGVQALVPGGDGAADPRRGGCVARVV